jgi:hypothetical protein
MGKVFDNLSAELSAWIGAQRMFFVASAALARDGLLNCSPKGLDSLRILGPREVAYLDLTGSGIETVAHVRENGRLVFLFCAFEGAPRIVRLHARARVVTPEEPEWAALFAQFPAHFGARAIVHATLTRIGDSCGWGVPRFEFVEQRDTLIRASQAKGEAGLAAYRLEKNAVSLDGLPGL